MELALVGCPPPPRIGGGHLVPDVRQMVAALVSVHVRSSLSYMDRLTYPTLELFSGSHLALVPGHVRELY